MNYLSVCNHYHSQHKDENKGWYLLWLMKMVYISHGFFLAYKKENPYIPADQFQAWENGPVLPDLYKQYKYNKAFDTSIVEASSITDKYDQELLEWVEFRYRGMDAFELVRLTHGAGTPWHQSYEKHIKGIVIPDKIIKKYYSELLDDIRKESQE